ncbi:MAG: CARDB domain-containing protein [Gammaproteobacteria bacterium]
MRDTATALETLSRFDTQFTGTGTALSWLHANAGKNSDYVAREIGALTALGGNPQWAELAALQNADGGWGFEQGYASDPLDTALALQALAPQATYYKSQVDTALQYLAGNQNADGGWGSADSTGSRVVATVAVLKALHELDRDSDPAAAKGLSWLVGKQNADGGFGDSPSTVPGTASALQLLVTLNKTGLIKGGPAAQYLIGQQNTDGSWSESAYATALAISALEHYSFPNWAITAPPVASPSSPSDGQRVTLTVSVTNDAQVATPQGVLRFYDGDPASGGTPIGADITIPPMSAAETLSFNRTWDTLNKAGAHTIYAVVDPDDQATEMSKKDNSASTAVTVQPAPAGVDLEITDSDIAIAPIRPNVLPTTLGITANVRNLGQTDAKSVRVLLWDGTPGVGTPAGDQTVDVLNRSNVVVNFPYDLKKAGTTNFTVQIDPDNQIAESDEGNNQASASVTTAPSVDLSVASSDISMDKSAPNVGDDVTFTVTLHNNGTLQGQSIQQTVKWRVTVPGALQFVAQLDPDNSVAEVDESNNKASLAFTSTAATGPNLAVSYKDLTFSPNPGHEGYPLSIDALVRNTGTVAADNVEVAFYNGDPSQGGTQIGVTQVIPGVAAGGSATASVNWAQIPDNSDKLIFVVVDPANKIAEFTESDNSAFNVLSVLSLPDLAISPADITLSPAFPKAGDTLAIAARVTNLGQQSAQNVLVRAYDGDPASGGTLIGEQTIASLDASGAATVNFSDTVQSSGTTRPIVIQVDPDNQILERYKLNNVANKDVAVQDGNFYVSNRYFSPNGDGVQDSTQLFFRLAQATDVTVDVVNAKGEVVRTLGGADTKNVSSGNVTWDGLDKLGRLVADGDYRLEVKGAGGVPAVRCSARQQPISTPIARRCSRP